PPADADFAVLSVDVLAGDQSPGTLRIVVSNDGRSRGTAPLVIWREGVPVRSVLPAPIDPGQQVTVELPWSDPDRGRIKVEINPRYARPEPRNDNNMLEINPRERRL